MKKMIITLFFICYSSVIAFKPGFAIYTSPEPYAIIKDGKYYRVGVEEKSETNKNNKTKEILGLKSEIIKNYGVKISEYDIFSTINYADTYIKFYNDIKIIVNGKKFILPKNKIVMNEDKNFSPKYNFRDIGVNIIKLDEFIIDIGEIEIVDSKANIIKQRVKVPPILFKKTYYFYKVNDYNGNDYDLYFYGWAEDFPEDPSTLKKMYNSIEEIKESIEKSKKKINK